MTTKAKPANEAEYLRELLKYFDRKQVDRWLADHPVPHNWKGGKYSYAYLEMIVW